MMILDYKERKGVQKSGKSDYVICECSLIKFYDNTKRGNNIVDQMMRKYSVKRKVNC